MSYNIEKPIEEVKTVKENEKKIPQDGQQEQIARRFSDEDMAKVVGGTEAEGETSKSKSESKSESKSVNNIGALSKQSLEELKEAGTYHFFQSRLEG